MLLGVRPSQLKVRLTTRLRLMLLKRRARPRLMPTKMVKTLKELMTLMRMVRDLMNRLLQLDLQGNAQNSPLTI